MATAGRRTGSHSAAVGVIHELTVAFLKSQLPASSPDDPRIAYKGLEALDGYA
jgi:hypothetical protein